MGIHDEDIARTRAAVDLVAIIGEHTEIKRSGRNWMARCPIHGERTPSLSVSPEKGVYYCFGCGASGDAITFVQEMENLDFVGAVESLAGRYGIQLRYTSAGEG
ncbi:MAG: DNA primase, partial [Actinobacteria bacterium]|nr:DNA primase [Actinomycetota bacterium]